MTQELHYFADPQLDRAVGLIMQLASEQHIATQRLHALEMLLVRRGVIAEGELDSFVPEGTERERLDAVRDRTMERLLRVLTESGPAEHPLREELVRAPSRGAR